MGTQKFKTFKDFLNREDKNINGVSLHFAEKNPNWKEMNKNNIGCWNCKNCEDCKGCYDCNNCINCYACWDCENCKDCFNCNYCKNCNNCNFCNSKK